MTTPPIEDADIDTVDAGDGDDPAEGASPGLGAQLMHRLRLPGPGRDTTRPPLIGSVASSSSRFASGLARSVPSRHQLRGPENASVQSIRTVNAAPPRWWSPDLVPQGEAAGPAGPLAPRGLPRAVHAVPNEGSRTPGGILGNLVSTAVPVRRMDAVTAAGPMLTSHDRQKLTAVAVNRSIAQQQAAAAPASSPAPAPRASVPRTPSLPMGPALPAARTAAPSPAAAPSPQEPPSSQEPPAPAAPPAPSASVDPPATPDGGPASPTSAAPTAAAPGAPPSGGADAPVASTRPSFLPERRSRLAAVRGGTLGGGLGAAATSTVGGLAGGFPFSVGALALAGADPLASPVADTPSHVRPLPRMVGGGHAVAASANAGRAPVAASDPLMFGAGRSAGEQSLPPAGPRRAVALAPAPTGTTTPATPTTTPTDAGAAPSAAGAPSTAPAESQAADSAPPTPAPSITSLPARDVPGTPDAPDAPGAPAADGGPSVAPGGGRGRRRASSEAVGIGLATTRSLHPTGRGGGDVRPSLSTGMLPALGATALGAAMGSAVGSAAAASHGWLPGAEQRTAGARTSLPGALSLPGRAAAGMGMADLLPSARGLAASGESATGSPLASAFGAADPITPAGSAASAAPAPPTGAAAADIGDDTDAGLDTGSPLGAARRRARSRARSASAAAAGTAGAVAGTTAAAGSGAAATDPTAFAPASAPAPFKRLVDTTAGTAPANYMPAPPPVSIGSASGGSAGSAVPPMSAAASLVRGGGDGGLKRSLIDVTAGMFDSMPGASDPSAADPTAPPVPASAQFDIGGSDMAEVERRLQVVRDGDTPVYAPSPLNDPAAMDDLVDEVVQRIEARVIDELERRGRRHNPGVF